jgi:hypothetical protein
VSDLLTRNVLVINQKAKLIELTDEYRIRDEDGNDIGISARRDSRSSRKQSGRSPTSTSSPRTGWRSTTVTERRWSSCTDRGRS